MASMTSAERHEVVSAKKRRKMSKAERIAKERKAAKNRKKRKYRTRVFKSKKGMKARGVGGKMIRKRFFVVTYDATGRSLGALWFATAKPSDMAKEEHLAKYGIKHPLTLPVVSPARLKSMKSKSAGSKKAKSQRRRS
jgi:hypothetical protein